MIISYPTSASGIIVLLKNNQEILLDLTDFAVQEQPEDNLMFAISRSWYNGSYTMAAKPIKSLELHYTMIQFLIIGFILIASSLEVRRKIYPVYRHYHSNRL